MVSKIAITDSFIRYSLGLDDGCAVDRLALNKTGESGTLYDHRKERSWRHLDLLQFQCFIHCRIPRGKFSVGVRTIHVPWADLSRRVTYEFERWTIDLLKSTKNQTKTAALLRCGFDVVNRIMHHSVSRGMERRKLGEIHHVSLDEKSYKHRRKFMTVLADGEDGIVLDVVRGRDLESTKTVLERTLGERLETVTMDMWKAYISVVKALLPKATLIHDRFHLIWYLNKAIDQVRRREAKNNEELKHSRFALLKNEDKRTEKQDEVFKIIQTANFQVSIAWRLREEFKSIFGGDSYSGSNTYFDLWLKSLKKESVKEVTKVAEMFERHYEGVCNALCHQQSNGKAERINGKIQEIKTVSRGYRKFENFRSAVLFFCGGLDIYPQQCR